MESSQKYRISNWDEVFNLVKDEYNSFFKEFHNYIEHIQNMIINSFLDAEEIISPNLYNKRKKEIYFDVLEELKKRSDYPSFELWIYADEDDYDKFCEYVISLEDKTLACLLIFEKVYHPKKEKRLDYYRYRKRLMEYDWYKVPIPFLDKKKVCFSCGNKYSLFMEKYSDSRKDISQRECRKCNYSPNYFKYNLQSGYNSDGNFISIYFNYSTTYIKAQKHRNYKKSSHTDFNKIFKKREEFKSKISKIISENIIKEEVILNWDESEKYDNWYQFSKEGKELDFDSKELISYIKNHPNFSENTAGHLAKKFIESNKLYIASIPFIKSVHYDIIEINLLVDLITENLTLFKLKDKTIEKLNASFSLKDWACSTLIPYERSPDTIRIPSKHEILVNNYFIKNFEKHKTLNRFTNNNLSQPNESESIVKFENKHYNEYRRLSVNMHKIPISDNKRRPLFSQIYSTKKDVIIKANIPYQYNAWRQNDGSVTFTFVPVNRIVETKRISYCDLDENTQNILMEFESVMNDEKSREDFFNIDDEISENPFSQDTED